MRVVSVGWAWSYMKDGKKIFQCDLYISSALFQSFRFTEEEHQILKSLFGCDDEADSYTLRVPGSHWLGAWKFRMVSEWGDVGARLYHKLRAGIEPELAVYKTTGVGKTVSHTQELTVTLKCRDGDTDAYAVEKIEASRGHKVSSDYTMDWRQLAMEAASPIRTRTPPSLLFIRGHAKFEGQKLANIRSTARPKKKGIMMYTVYCPSMLLPYSHALHSKEGSHIYSTYIE